MTQFYGSFKAGDSTCSCFLWCACIPLRAETRSQYSVSCWLVTLIWLYYAILCLFVWSQTLFAPRLVSFHHRLSLVVTCSFYAVFFTRSRSCRLCCDRICEPGYAVTRAHIIGADPLLIWDAEYAIPSSLEVDFGNANLESRTDLMPVQCLNNTPTTSPWKQERETGTGSRKHLMDENFPGRNLRDENFMGDRGHFLWLAPHWGSLEDCLAFIGYRKLCRVILGPRSNFIMYCLRMVCTVYSVLSQQ